MRVNKELCQELTELLGFSTFTRKSVPCTGKWRGTTDYSLVFDGKITQFISNGMKYFNQQVMEYIGFVKKFRENKTLFLQQIREQAERDNITAQNEGLFPVVVKNIGINTFSEHNLIWPYIQLEINGVEVYHIETGLKIAIRNNDLTDYFNEKNQRKLFTAGAVLQPTYIFANVRFSHLDGLYKI